MIRTADARGRVSGFRPFAEYHVYEGGGTYRLVAVVRELGVPQPIAQAGTDYLSEFGIEARNVSSEDHDETGYWVMLRDREGRRIVSPDGELLQEWRDWPKGFDYLEFVRRSNASEVGV